MIAFLIYVNLLAFSLGFNIAQHGKERKGTNNAWVAFIAYVIEMSLLIMVVYGL